MLLKSFRLWLALVAMPMCAVIGWTQVHQNRASEFVLVSPVNETTAVRFFYQPSGNYFHFPLVFRAIDQKDARLNTAPMAAEGRTAYISLSDMQRLMQDLADSELMWQESDKVEALESFRKLEISDNMVITVASSKGTAAASLSPTKICKTLKPLDSAIKSPRALWEFQGFRLNYGCKVPEFVSDAYQDH
jgi:hypothetical protein